MRAPVRQNFSLSTGGKLSFFSAGEKSKPAVVLIHGFPNSSEMFRNVMPTLAEVGYIVAPDLPGFGESDILPSPTFPAFARAIGELLEHLEIGPRYLYLHDFGAPVGFDLALRSPQLVAGVIIQNANAHRTGHGPEWADTIAYWSNPSAENEAAATHHLTLEGTRDQYLAGVPPEIAAVISSDKWEEDWRRMNLPGRMDMQRALIADYGKYVARFPEIEAYLARWQPPALMLWGRHDAFFNIAETLSWMTALPRMEAHIFDGGHLLLETHSKPCAQLMVNFLKRARHGEKFETELTC